MWCVRTRHRRAGGSLDIFGALRLTILLPWSACIDLKEKQSLLRLGGRRILELEFRALA